MSGAGSADHPASGGITVRPARPADAGAVAELLTALDYPASEAEVAARLRRLAAESGAGVLVAEVDGEVAGVVSYQITELLERARPQCRITALVTHGRRRRRGAATALLRAVESAARGRGCFRLEVTSRPERTEALRFYTAMGFHERPRRLVKPLGERGGR
jgi:GNAT superfamily N-acetyltransferase